MPPEGASNDYVLGWEHGFQAAQAGETIQRQMPEPSSTTWLLAAGSFIGAGAGIVSIVLAETDSNHPIRPVLAVLGVSGLLLGALASSLRVLQGEPTPELGLKAPGA